MDPKTFQFYTSQPLLGCFPYQVVILTEMGETMKMFPTSVSAGSVPSPSVTSSSTTTSSALAGVTTSMSSQVPLCSSVPLFSPNYPPPSSAPNPSTGVAHQVCVSDNETVKKLVTSVQKIEELLEKALVSASKSEQSDSEFESFTSATMTCSSKNQCVAQPLTPVDQSDQIIYFAIFGIINCF